VCSGLPDEQLAAVVMPWFCPNDDCSTLSWNPRQPLEVNLTSASFVELPAAFGGQGGR
jgi:hypothetical protein